MSEFKLFGVIFQWQKTNEEGNESKKSKKGKKQKGSKKSKKSKETKKTKKSNKSKKNKGTKRVSSKRDDDDSDEEFDPYPEDPFSVPKDKSLVLIPFRLLSGDSKCDSVLKWNMKSDSLRLSVRPI